MIGAKLDVRARNSLVPNYHEDFAALVDPPMVEISDATCLARLISELLKLRAASLQGGFDRMMLIRGL